jgi:N-acylglucosamine 2-epimerase
MCVIDVPKNDVALLDFFKKTLYEEIVPFWLKYAVDKQYGGLQTCIADNGVIVSTDKFIWSQLRALWSFSSLYKNIDQRQAWLDVAHGIFDFVKKHGINGNGDWLYQVSREGNDLAGPISIFSDGFAIYGLAEYYSVTGDEEAKKLAYQTIEHTLFKLETLKQFPVAPDKHPENTRLHAIPMIFSWVFEESGRIFADDHIRHKGYVLACEIMDRFLQKDNKLILEYLDNDFQKIDSPMGRAVLPGHAIESLWFMIHLFERRNDAKRVQEAFDSIKAHMDIGWDYHYDGLFLGIDSEQKNPLFIRHADRKIWWPHTEALYGLLLARERTGASWAKEWFDAVFRYSFSHYPVRGYGEWTQNLTREGKREDIVVALPVKDPYHLIRSIIYCIKILENNKPQL